MLSDNVDNADTPEKCLQQCNLNSGCNFWDIDETGVCRLRSNQGTSGKVDTSGSSCGPKNCIFSKSLLNKIYIRQIYHLILL